MDEREKTRRHEDGWNIGESYWVSSLQIRQHAQQKPTFVNGSPVGTGNPSVIRVLRSSSVRMKDCLSWGNCWSGIFRSWCCRAGSSLPEFKLHITPLFLLAVLQHLPPTPPPHPTHQPILLLSLPPPVDPLLTWLVEEGINSLVLGTGISLSSGTRGGVVGADFGEWDPES